MLSGSIIYLITPAVSTKRVEARSSSWSLVVFLLFAFIIPDQKSFKPVLWSTWWRFCEHVTSSRLVFLVLLVSNRR